MQARQSYERTHKIPHIVRAKLGRNIFIPKEFFNQLDEHQDINRH
jgi:hypothetical protein